MRRSLVFTALGAAAAFGTYALWPRSTSPEAQVRAAMAEMERGLGARDVGAVLAPVSEQFHSSTLGDQADVRRLVLSEVLRGGGVRVVTLQSEVLPEADGRLRWRGRVAGARAGGAGLAAVTDAELRQFSVEALFANEGGTWRVVEATLHPLD